MHRLASPRTRPQSGRWVEEITVPRFPPPQKRPPRWPYLLYALALLTIFTTLAISLWRSLPLPLPSGRLMGPVMVGCS